MEVLISGQIILVWNFLKGAFLVILGIFVETIPHRSDVGVHNVHENLIFEFSFCFSGICCGVVRK